MSSNDIAALLERYLTGHVSPEERERVENWLQNHELDQAAWKKLPEQDREQWVADVFSKIRATIHTKDEKVVRMSPYRRSWLRISAAAAVLIAVALTYALWQGRQGKQFETLTALRVPAHQKKQITLPDGSMVWVNEGSELQYPQAISSGPREVYLFGEAYFDIRQDASRPFIIHTGKVITTVLGTAFNIREDKGLHTVVVTVTMGRVKVSGSKGDLGIITPNQQISVNELSEVAVRSNVDVSQTIAWKEDDLHFEDITLAEAATKLEQRFHRKIDFSNNRISNCRFTGTASSGEGLDKILKVICTFNNVTYQTKADGSILIDGPGCD
ncbi:MAG: FecR domain-containing protein [Puia sp.]|nr:FecR domain-containing protein [Puia sp.]